MPAHLSTGAVLAGHRLDAIVARGGMGVLYRATHLALDRTVALKVILPELAAVTAFRERFEEESRTAASIDHPNVIPIYHAGEEDGVLFITMRYVEGTDVRALVDSSGRLEPALAAHIVDATGAALDAAHGRGLVHRDVKPANILIDGAPRRPHVYLTDFGLTKRMGSTGGLTQSGQFVGTLDYVAPEQIQGSKAVDGRADVYALGCVLFEALTGRVPFPVDDERAKLFAHLDTPPPSMTELRPDLPAALGEVISTAMAKAPGDRFATAGELGRAAVAAAAAPATKISEPPAGPATVIREPSRATVASRPSLGGHAPTVTTAAEPGTSRRRDRRLPLLAGLVLLAAVVVVAGLQLLSEDGEPTSIGIGGSPGSITTGEGSVWVVNEDDRTVLRIAAEEGADGGRQITRFRGLDPRDVAVGGGSAWITTSDRRLVRVDPASNSFTGDPLALPGAAAIATGAGAVWVADGGASVVRVDDDTQRTTAIPVRGGPSRVAVGEGSVWVIHSGGRKVSRIAPRSRRVVGEPIDVPAGSDQLAVGEGRVWVANSERRLLVRIDPRSGRLSGALLRLRAAPSDLAVGEGAVWLTSADERVVTRVDPRAAGGGTRTVRLGSQPQRLAVGEGAVWVTLPAVDGITRLDPAAFDGR
jgi:streptogramin lyase